ncbi:MAG: hypothetical protein M3021_13075, partial [Actinomycetota bacterium]|nr:hypothetical protein [Actinomycetota bacterium]
GERKPYGDRAPRGDRPFADRPAREGERKPYGDRAPRGDRPFADRPAREGERKPYGDRAPRSDRPANNRPYNDRAAPRKEWQPRGDGAARGDHGSREDRPAATHNARDLRSANRPDRERSPQIDDDVTGTELDKVTRAQLRTLEENSAEWVSRHLVMAGRLMDVDPELSFQHALAASRRGGRLAAVREAVGLTAYAAGHYGEALREFRTYRRISGSNEHLPVMADCERGMGRPDRALDLIRSEDAETLDTAGRVELAIVASGARADLGEREAAVAALEIAQLDMNRAFSFSPRLFRAYSDALEAAGRSTEAATWRRQAVKAESALGIGEDADPFIVDLAEEEEDEGKPKKRQDTSMFNADGEAIVRKPTAPVKRASAPLVEAVSAEEAATSTVDAAAVDNIDDAESDYFDSDDAESDEFSADPDEAQDGSGHDVAEDSDNSTGSSTDNGAALEDTEDNRSAAEGGARHD